MTPSTLRLIPAALAAALVSAPAAARAQVPTVDPGGALADPAAPADGTYAPATSGAASSPASGDGATGDGEPAAGGYYYADGVIDDVEPDEPGGVRGGPVPDVHVVKRGDTLWDLCWFYFNNPWEWPKVWSYNPEITNPHWIYPGDQIRLRGAGSAPAVASGQPVGAGGPAADLAARPASVRRDDGVGLRQVAFVDIDDLKFAARIDGSPEEKVMLARGDEAYLSYPKDRPPKVGQRYSVYAKRRDVRHPDGDKVIGAYVNVIGELEVISVKKDKRARAVVIDSIDVIERGAMVGPLKQRFTQLEPTDAKVDLQGTIVGVLGSDQLIGARQVVFIDKGAAAGVRPGNRMYAVRRGDAYEQVMGPSSNVGKDDPRFPARALGELLVVDVAKNTSLAVVTFAVQELGIGDHVVLSRATN
jgi:hypothetical protein